MKIVVAALVGLVAGVLVGLLFKFVAAIGDAVPADWHDGVTRRCHTAVSQGALQAHLP